LECEDWEELISDEENGNEELEANNVAPQLTRRRRPSNQTPEERAAWDRETKDIRNAKARERRAQKKLEAQSQALA
jgi:hypothetical protein